MSEEPSAVPVPTVTRHGVVPLMAASTRAGPQHESLVLGPLILTEYCLLPAPASTELCGQHPWWLFGEATTRRQLAGSWRCWEGGVLTLEVLTHTLCGARSRARGQQPQPIPWGALRAAGHCSL